MPAKKIRTNNKFKQKIELQIEKTRKITHINNPLELTNFSNLNANANPKNIIIDPGFGFGKTLEHNYKLLRHFRSFEKMGYPVLAGVSRKSMINKVLKTNPQKALNGTTVLNTIALLNGANILRVHDVKEAMEAINLVEFYNHSNNE